MRSLLLWSGDELDPTPLRGVLNMLYPLRGVKRCASLRGVLYVARLPTDLGVLVVEPPPQQLGLWLLVLRKRLLPPLPLLQTLLPALRRRLRSSYALVRSRARITASLAAATRDAVPVSCWMDPGFEWMLAARAAVRRISSSCFARTSVVVRPVLLPRVPLTTERRLAPAAYVY